MCSRSGREDELSGSGDGVWRGPGEGKSDKKKIRLPLPFFNMDAKVS